jgi:hypothetical protein
MPNDVQSAWIAAGASIAVSMVSLATAVWSNIRTERARRDQNATAAELERLKSSLSNENDAAKAKRDYEYEARKRLYAELYPLAFHLHEAALGAQNRIRNLALAARGGWLLPGPNNWMTGGDPYYITSVIYSLIAPLAVYDLMTRKLTLLDLTLDHELQRQHFIARRSYEALRSDFDLIDPRYPPLVLGPGSLGYAPPEQRPTALPGEQEQRWTWRQGLYSGQISQAVDALLTTTGTATRVMSYAEFAKALDHADLRTDDKAGGTAGVMKNALRPIADVFRDFHPARRPVTWRILLTQAACYRAIAAVQNGASTPDAILRAARYAGATDNKAYDWIGDGSRSIPPALNNFVDFQAEQASAMATADRFIENTIKDFASRYRSSA